MRLRTFQFQKLSQVWCPKSPTKWCDSVPHASGCWNPHVLRTSANTGCLRAWIYTPRIFIFSARLTLLDVVLSVRPSVCHTCDLRLYGSRYRNKFRIIQQAMFRVSWRQFSYSSLYGCTPNECVIERHAALSKARWLFRLSVMASCIRAVSCENM